MLPVKGSATGTKAGHLRMATTKAQERWFVPSVSGLNMTEALRWWRNPAGAGNAFLHRQECLCYQSFKMLAFPRAAFAASG